MLNDERLPMAETVAYTLLGIERVHVRKDLAYKTKGGAPWRLNLYLPEDYQEKDMPPRR